MGKWKSLTASEKAKVIKFAIDNGISDINTIRDTYNMYADGGSIHIKPENRGKFTELKERTGKSSTWYKEHGTPEQRKMATFALNARKWNHKHDGTESDSRLHIETNNKRSREEALLSAVKVFNNYIDAKDNQMGKIETAARIAAKYLADWNLNPLGSGISNCTLSTSQWVNPDNPLMRAASIVENPNPYFTKISKEYAIPGDILITKNPNHNSYHTMMITGFKDNIPLVTYSSGGTNTEKNLRKNILLSNYHQRDIEQGGNHIEDLYYRPLYNNEVILPEIVVTPNGSFVNYDAKAQGGKIHIDPSKKGTFTAAATKHGKSVQAFASQVLANKENYSPAMVKKANFARNASKWHADGGPEFLLNENIQNKEVWLNYGTRFQKQRPGTVNIQNIQNALDSFGSDTQYVWDSPEHKTYSAYRINPNYRPPLIPAERIETPLTGIATSSLALPKITVSIPKPKYLPKKANVPTGTYIPLFGENNGAQGYVVSYLERSPDNKDYYQIEYQSAPGSLNNGEGSVIQTDSVAAGLPIEDINTRIFDYKTKAGGHFAKTKLSTGGPLYPFSFQKTSYGKTPIVRY